MIHFSTIWLKKKQHKIKIEQAQDAIELYYQQVDSTKTLLAQNHQQTNSFDPCKN
jgi:hypothetical protein